MPTTLDEQIKEYMRTGVISDEKGRHVKGAVLCRMCGRLFAHNGIYVGKARAQDVLCPECLRKTEGAAYLMCTCGQYIGLYKPGITPDEKYEVKPGDTLHLSCCPSCKPGSASSFVVELADFMQRKLGNAPQEPQNGMERKA